MSEHEKAAAIAPSLDPRAAEVLRCLDRAKGTIAKTRPNLTIEATAESLDSTARALEGVIVQAGERLADFQRAQDRRPDVIIWGTILNRALHAVSRRLCR